MHSIQLRSCHTRQGSLPTYDFDQKLAHISSTRFHYSCVTTHDTYWIHDQVSR
jgi:hypothetical protein